MVLDKGQLRETNTTNLEELKDEIRKLWVLRINNTPYTRKLGESISDRIQKEIRSDGNLTLY